MRYAAVLALLLLTSPLCGQTTPPDIQFPNVTPPLVPPTPPPGTIPVLPADVMYCITSNKAFFVRPSPSSLVSVQIRQGPLTIQGKFIEDPTRTVLRDFPAGQQVAIVMAADTGRVELIVIPSGVTSDNEIQSRIIDCLVGPLPPPTPTPTPPTPTPTPPGPKPPIPEPGFRTLVVYESGDLSTLPPSQLSVLYSKSVRDYLNAKCVMGPGGKTKEFRFWDNDVDTSGESALWQAAMKLPRSSLPWIVISNGASGFQGPLPGTIDETLALLKKYAEPPAKR